jgi:hypothetical protein
VFYDYKFNTGDNLLTRTVGLLSKHAHVYIYINSLILQGQRQKKAGLTINGPLTINVENLTKSVNRKWMSDRPEIESHSMGPYEAMLYAKYQEALISSC